MNWKELLARHLLKRTYKPNGHPVVVGNRKWEYVDRPRGIKRWFKRPKIRYIHGFTYYYQGSQPVVIEKGMKSDTFTMPWVLVVASLGFFDFVMERLVWVSGVHDKACDAALYDKATRADIFRECVWFAFDELSEDIDEKQTGMLKKAFSKASSKLRNVLLVGGVKIGSLLGYC